MIIDLLFCWSVSICCHITHTYLYFSVLLRFSIEEDGSVWNGSSDALLRRERDDIGISMRSGGHSGIPVRATGRHSESLAGADGPPGLRGLIRAGLPLPCQTFPACRNGGEIQLK